MNNDGSELAARLSSLIACVHVCLKAVTYVDSDIGLADAGGPPRTQCCGDLLLLTRCE